MPNPVNVTTLATIPSVLSPPLGFDDAKAKNFPPPSSLLTPPLGEGVYNILGTSGSVQQINVPGGNVTSGGGIFVEV